LTSNKGLKSRIVVRILGLLGSLRSYGFSKPFVRHENWSTTITLMLTSIALEIEIDWRDFDIFVLVVRLKNGNLPSGYYVSEGRACRYHLQKVISDRKWSVDRDALAMISPGKKGKRQNGKQSEGTMLDRFYAYKRVIDSCVEILVAEEEMIFQG
jgi:hypothetical protein